LTVAGVTQVPLPLQLAAGVSVFPVQVAAAHEVPEAYFRQAPLPSQKPSRPQVEAAAIVHWLSGSVPAATAEQLPAELAQLTHVPLQVVEQQVLCWQRPELHSLPEAQVAPSGFWPQVPAGSVQVLGDAQSVVLAHVVLQTLFVVSQAYGSQSEVVTVLQEPAPSQVRAGVSVEPVQLPATQTVPLA
jgi:hypothetical protein